MAVLELKVRHGPTPSQSARLACQAVGLLRLCLNLRLQNCNFKDLNRPEGGDRNGSTIGSTIAVQLQYICSTAGVQLAVQLRAVMALVQS